MPPPSDADHDRTDRPVFFFHVMKTGGMTLFQHIRRNFDPSEIYPDPALDLDGTHRLAPFTLAYLRALPVQTPRHQGVHGSLSLRRRTTAGRRLREQ